MRTVSGATHSSDRSPLAIWSRVKVLRAHRRTHGIDRPARPARPARPPVPARPAMLIRPGAAGAPFVGAEDGSVVSGIITQHSALVPQHSPLSTPSHAAWRKGRP